MHENQWGKGWPKATYAHGVLGASRWEPPNSCAMGVSKASLTLNVGLTWVTAVVWFDMQPEVPSQDSLSYHEFIVLSQSQASLVAASSSYCSFVLLLANTVHVHGLHSHHLLFIANWSALYPRFLYMHQWIKSVGASLQIIPRIVYWIHFQLQVLIQLITTFLTLITLIYTNFGIMWFHYHRSL